jgi:hypothetical protein
MAITNSLRKVLIFVPDPDAILLNFDKISLLKSTTGTSGDYTEILKSIATAATLKGTKSEGFPNLAGKDFKFEVDGTEYSMTFATAYTAAEAAAEIVLATGQIANDDGGKVRITSSSTGLLSTVEIHESTEGGVELGFYLGAHDIGEDPWITVVSGTKLYVLDDPHGDDSYWYKTEYVNSTTLVRSDESAPFQARPLGALPPSDLIYGVGYLADTEGNPAVDKMVVLYNRYVPTVVSGVLIDGPETRIYRSDSLGLVAIPLVHGSKVSVGIEGTKLRRDIDVPDTGDSFDLFDQSLLDDRLGIAYYPIVDAERTTL